MNDERFSPDNNKGFWDCGRTRCARAIKPVCCVLSRQDLLQSLNIIFISFSTV